MRPIKKYMAAGLVGVNAFGSEVNLRLTSRSGLSLIDSVAGNNAAIRLPMVDTSRVDSTHWLKCDTGIVPAANTVMIVKGRMTVINVVTQVGQDDNTNFFRFGTGASSKWGAAWGNKTFVSTANADTDPHVFIFYNGKLWVRPITLALSDSEILNVINNVAADATAASPTWGTAVRSIYLGTYSASYNAGGSNLEISDTYIGTITTGVITWQRKYILNNIYYAYDLLNASNSAAWVNGSGSTPTKPTKIYNQYGSSHCLDNGHTLLQYDIKTFVSVPYLLSGSPNHTVANPTGFATVKDFPGSASKLNYTDCIIRFVGSQFDRSNTTLFSSEARASISRYDAANVNDWHVTELNRNWLDTWQNSGYEGTKFIRTESNSMRLDEATNIVEIITTNVNKTGNAFNGALSYCGDYTLYYYPLWDKRKITSNDIIKSVTNKSIATGQTESSSEFGSLAGIFKFGKPVVAPNGYIYAPPFYGLNVLKIDPDTDTSTLFTDPAIFGPDWKWSAFVLAPTGMIYGIPYTHTQILKINPLNDTISFIGSFASSAQKWGSGTMAPNGYIYFIPHCYGAILKFNPIDESTSEVGSFIASTINLTSGFVKWGDGILAPNGCIYCMPYFYQSILKIDTSNDTTTLIGDYGLAVKWVAACLAPGGIIYGLPYNDPRIIKIDTNTDTISFINTGLTGGSAAELYHGCAMGANGIIYGVPGSATQILRLDPSNDSVSFFGSHSTSLVKWVGGVMAKNGAIYSPPRADTSTTILKILTNYNIDDEIALSRVFNGV